MATTPGSKRRDTRTTSSGELPPDPETLGTMQEPLGSMDRPVHRTSDMNDLNISNNGASRTAGNLGTTGSAERRGRGFTATFAIVAAILVAAFLVALYFGAGRSTNEASAPSGTQAPVAETAPGSTTDTTGSTSTAPSQETAPATGTTGTGSTTGGTGTGTTAPANP